MVKICRIGEYGVEIPAALVDGIYYDLRSITSDITSEFLGSDEFNTLSSLIEKGNLEVLEVGAGHRFGAPICTPGKIVCVGLNYKEHAIETGAEFPKEPVVFMKDPSTVIGPFDEVKIPRGSKKTDWEVELGVIIGKEARYLASPAEAASKIAGFAISHDVSEREFQLERGGQWDKGKSCETFNPLGPYLVPSSTLADPQNLRLQLWVNGDLKQDGNTSDQIFPINYVVWYLSQFMVLRPGDLVNTGTPSGVALGLPNQPYLRPGDIVELEIEGLGKAKQRFVSA